MFYLCLAFNSIINKHVFKIGSTCNIINKMKEMNKTYKSNGVIHLVAFTELISYAFKKQFMKIPEIQSHIIGNYMFEIDQTVYDIFIDCCSDKYFKILNYKDVISLAC